MKLTPEMEEHIRASTDYRNDPSVLERFPNVNPKVVPTGARVLCQLMSNKPKSSGGIILVEETKETERWNMQVARVLAVGDLAFCNRTTAEPWKEGTWAEPGDFVIIPRWGGQRRTVKRSGDTDVFFVTVNDHEIIERVYGNPLELESYIL